MPPTHPNSRSILPDPELSWLKNFHHPSDDTCTCSLKYSSCVCTHRGNSQHTLSELLKVSAGTTIINKLGLSPLAEAIVSGQIANARLLLAKVPESKFAE